MAIIALTSASGAPGVTTTALALTLLWPRQALLVEASPMGGSAVLAGYLRGAVAPEGRSLLALARAQRLGTLAEAVDASTVALDDEGRRRLLPAISHPEQAPSLDRLWAPLAEVLRDLDDAPPPLGGPTHTSAGGVDVIVDAGRWGAAHGPEPLVAAADVVLLCIRTQLPSIAAARARIESLRRADSAGEVDGVDGRVASRIGLVVVGDGRPYTAAEIAHVVGAPVVASLAWDPTAADVVSIGSSRPRRWESSPFVRSAGTLSELLQRRLRSAPESRRSATSSPAPFTASTVAHQ